MKENPEEPETKDVISEGTPVRLGLVIASAAASLAFLGWVFACIWWASALNANVKNIQSLLLDSKNDAKAIAAQVSELAARMTLVEKTGSPQVQILQGQLSDIRERVKLIETQGSPALVPRVLAVEQGVTKVKEDLELHKATTAGK